MSGRGEGGGGSGRDGARSRGRSAWTRLRRFLGRTPSEDADQELAFHLEMRVADYVRSGMSEAEARAAALARLGDVERLRREMGDAAAADARSERRRDWLADLRQDVAYGVRALARAPLFTSVSVGTLALGIGATTAIFSLVWNVLLAPLPYPKADRLVKVWETTPQGSTRNVVSGANVDEWQRRARSFDVLGAHSFSSSMALTGDGAATRVGTMAIQAEALDAVGVAPVLGRSLEPEDFDEGSAVVLSHRVWSTRYGSDPGVLGRTVELDGRTRTVVGVMPAGFAFPSGDIDFWVPLAGLMINVNDRTSHSHQVVARLADGVTLEAAQREMTTLAGEIATEHPAEMSGWGVRVVPLQDDVTRDVRALFWVLLGGVGVVLLATCANVANLLLARAVARHREMALRGALGAARSRLLRQLLTESAMLAVLGAAGAMIVAPLVLGFMVGAAPADVPLVDQAHIDVRMLAFTGAVALACAVLFGMAPALKLSRSDLQSTLRTGRDASQGGHVRLRAALLAAQVALSVMLLAGAGLFVRSFRAIQAADLGFDPEGIALMRVDAPMMRYYGTPSQLALYEPLIEGVGAIPGVVRTAATTQQPGDDVNLTMSFVIDGRAPTNASGREDPEPLHAVTPGYFETLGMRMVAGRTFEAADRADAPPVAILSESLARRYFPDGDAIGQRITFRLGETPWREVVGVVEDARLESPDREAVPGIFIPFAQKEYVWMTTITVVARVRPGVDPVSVGDDMGATLASLDPSLPPLSIRTLDDAFRENTARRSFAMTLVGGFGVLALVLCVVGLYGLLSYSIARERREIGVRVALGAQASDVVTSVVVRALSLTAVGTVVGLVLASVAGRGVESLLYGVSAIDPWAYAGAAGLMALVAVLTSAWPAVRAARTDPLAALRSE